MKQLISSAFVALVVSLAVWVVMDSREVETGPDVDALAGELAVHEAFQERFTPTRVNFSMQPEIATWVSGTSYTGTDSKTLSSAENSVCFLTHVEVAGIQAPEDRNACTVTVDDFTGFWEVNATVGEGGLSEVRCNARCVVWE